MKIKVIDYTHLANNSYSVQVIIDNSPVYDAFVVKDLTAKAIRESAQKQLEENKNRKIRELNIQLDNYDEETTEVL